MKPLVIVFTMLSCGLTFANSFFDLLLGTTPPFDYVQSIEKVNYAVEKPVYKITSYDDYYDYDDYDNDSEYYTDEGYGEVFEFEDFGLCRLCGVEIVILDYNGNRINY